MKIAVFFVGEVRDAGFNASALAGADVATAEGLAEISIISGVRYDQDAIRARLAEVVPEVDGLVFIGGQGNITTPEIAAQYPGKKFAIVQGQKTGPNLASYDVLQEDSAFLAGALAARLTQSGTVGHLSGHRVPPGLKGRAAFVAGARQANPDIQVLTGFCGTQDDRTVTKAWAAAEISAGADIIFTMLNDARSGAIEACREGRARQIGNAMDWVEVDPEVFIASAIARIDLGVKGAIKDMVAGIIPDTPVHLGLAQGDFASLSMGGDVLDVHKEYIAKIAQDIRNGTCTVPNTYDGPEFQP
ncbi:BMP family protein [Falsihalocynthiibacter sp. S25ZX9]|uniref:BMP family protein n=1 Tax=Falsihalocynthiibacter sp. S25ZX9 TaxID=3240870 RepID=UPI00350F7E27